MKNTIKLNFIPISIFSLVSFLAVFPIAAHATPPASPYTPGETLDPNCAPGGTNCTITAPISGSATSTQVGFFISTTTISSDANFTWTSSTRLLGLSLASSTVASSTVIGLRFLNATGTSIAVSASSTITYLNFLSASGTTLKFSNATGTSLTLTASSSISYFNFTNATGSLLFVNNISSTNASSTNTWFTNATSTNLSLTATGTTALFLSGFPQGIVSSSLLALGPYPISGHGSGTYIGINVPAFSGNFVDFQIASSSKFKIDNGGNVTALGSVSSTNLWFTNATGTALLLSASSTINYLNFINATGTSLTASASSSIYSLNFTAATGTASLNLVGSSTLAIATTSQVTASSSLTVCALNNCVMPSLINPTTTAAVAFFASGNGLTSGISISGKGIIQGGSSDIGEYINLVGDENNYEAGDVLSIAEAESPQFEKSATPYDSKLAGVITVTAGLVAGGGEDYHGSKIMALAGRVPVKVTNKNGSIAIGDYLTSSDIPGVAMKATESGRVIGIALQSMSATSTDANGMSKIMVFVNPHWTFAVSEINKNGLSSSIESGPGFFNQLTISVKDGLKKLGALLENGVLKLQQLIADKISTKELCIDDVCVNRDQLKEILDKNSIQYSQPSQSSNPTESVESETISPAENNDATTSVQTDETLQENSSDNSQVIDTTQPAASNSEASDSENNNTSSQ